MLCLWPKYGQIVIFGGMLKPVFPIGQLPGSLFDAEVAVPVANLRRAPSPFVGGPQEKDRSQETQLLRGEKLRILAKQRDWIQVEALEQPIWDAQAEGWRGYPGWVRAEAVRPSSIQSPADSSALPSAEMVSAQAAPLVGKPYFWGGRCPYQPDQPASGMDCSGLLSWVYRQLGWVIPRNAHDQFLSCRRLDQESTQPGQLLFLSAPGNPQRIDHVALLEKDNILLEATEITQTVRRVSLPERLDQISQQGQQELYWGQIIN